MGPAEDNMAVVETYPPGSFCWLELATADAADAKRFYAGLFDWKFQEIPIAPGMVYTTARIGSSSVGALYQISERDAARGVRPAWLSYISVVNLPDTVARAEALGASVIHGPIDVFDLGKAAVVRDPEGAPFALWQPGGHVGAGLVKEPGAMAWNEFASREPVRAASFYTALFGWTPSIEAEEERGLYAALFNGVVPAGGIRTIPEEWGDVPPFWMGYFTVRHCEEAADRAFALGGTVEYGPLDIPDFGRYAVIADPHLALFAVVEPTQTQP
jgi:uncharacterized protein